MHRQRTLPAIISADPANHGAHHELIQPMHITSTATPQVATGDAALLRAMGFWALSAAVVNMIVGGGIFALPAALAKTVGTAAPISYLLGALTIIPIALCFAAAGSRVTATGGPYTYVGAAFGPFAGFVIGVLMWVSNVASSGGVAAGLTDQVAHLSPAFASGVPRTTLLILIYTALSWLNARGVRAGSRAILSLAAIKLTPLLILVVGGLFFVHTDFIRIDALPSLPALGSSMVLVMFAYSGMETALVPSAEMTNPSRLVPRATVTAILFVVVLYVGLQIVTQGILGGVLADSATPLAATAGALWPGAAVMLLITATMSMLGFLQGNLLGTSRLVYALARDGYLPSLLARVTVKTRVPIFAIVVHAGISCTLALIGNFAALVLISGGAICLTYFATSVAAWVLQRRGVAEQGKPFVLPGGGLIPVIACAALALVLVTLTRIEWLAISIAVAAVVALYGVMSWWRGQRT